MRQTPPAPWRGLGKTTPRAALLAAVVTATVACSPGSEPVDGQAADAAAPAQPATSSAPPRPGASADTTSMGAEARAPAPETRPSPEMQETSEELRAIAEAHPEVPTPAEIDALLADPALHSGRMPDDRPPALGPESRPSAPEAPRTHPHRRALGERLFDALREGELEAVAALTPSGSEALRAACPDREVDLRELEARFAHCRRAFDWSRVAEATVNGGEPTAAPVEGCEPGLRAHTRLRVQVRTTAGARHDAELRDVVGREGEILGFMGTLTCVPREGG